MTKNPGTTIGLIGLAIFLTGCWGNFDVYSSNQKHRTVQFRGNGIYIVYYQWPDVEKQFGKDRHSAIPQYLKANNLIPNKCSHEVKVIRGGEAENGKGWSEFTC